MKNQKLKKKNPKTACLVTFMEDRYKNSQLKSFYFNFDKTKFIILILL